MLDSMKWHGNACFSMGESPNIMIDPYSVVYDGVSPDLILVSHEHYDHCSPGDIEKLRSSNTIVLASRSAADMIDGEVTVVRPWQVFNFGRTSIKTVPAYTFSGDHPAHREDVGFVISHNYMDIYYASDSDFIPELRSMRCDVAILPVSQRVMPLESAAELVQTIKPRYVVPSHMTSERSSQLELQAFERELSQHADVVSLPSTGSGDANHLFARR